MTYGSSLILTQIFLKAVRRSARCFGIRLADPLFIIPPTQSIAVSLEPAFAGSRDL